MCFNWAVSVFVKKATEETLTPGTLFLGIPCEQVLEAQRHCPLFRGNVLSIAGPDSHDPVSGVWLQGWVVTASEASKRPTSGEGGRPRGARGPGSHRAALRVLKVPLREQGARVSGGCCLQAQGRDHGRRRWCGARGVGAVPLGDAALAAGLPAALGGVAE